MKTIKPFLFLISILLIYPSSVSSKKVVPPPNGIATVCFNSGNCYEITRVRIMGVWKNACCEDLPPADSCTDDCGPLAMTAPDPPSVAEATPHMTVGDGNKVWIVEDDELSTNTYNESSSEYQFLDDVPNFDFLNQTEDVEFITMKIDDDTYAIIQKSEGSQYRKKEFNDFFIASEEISVENSHLKLFPNPIRNNEKLRVEVASEIKSIALINSSGAERNELNFTKISERLFEANLSSTLSEGYYQVRVELKNGLILNQKLIITK